MRVVLLSYMRPALTKEAIERLVRSNSVEDIWISIDGLSEAASSEERARWERTIAVSRSFEESHPSVQVRVRAENLGLTSHVSDIMEEAFLTCQSLVLLEEDIAVDVRGFDFLSEVTSNLDSPRAGALFSKYSHSCDVLDPMRLTFFPEQWGLGFNKLFFQEYSRVRRLSRIDWEELLPAVDKSLQRTPMWTRRNVAKYWAKLFTVALSSPNNTDALFLATSMLIGVPYRVPLNSLASDRASLDGFGMNPRPETETAPRSHSRRLKNGFCLACERGLSRRWVAGFTYQSYERLYMRLKSLDSGSKG